MKVPNQFSFRQKRSKTFPVSCKRLCYRVLLRYLLPDRHPLFVGHRKGNSCKMQQRLTVQTGYASVCWLRSQLPSIGQV